MAIKINIAIRHTMLCHWFTLDSHQTTRSLARRGSINHITFVRLCHNIHICRHTCSKIQQTPMRYFRNKNLQVAEFDLTSVLSNDYRNGIAESCLTSLTANPQVLAEIKTEEDVNSLLEDINNSIRSKLTPFLQEKAMQNAAGELPELDLCFKLDGIIHGQELEEYLTENTIPDIEITYRNPEGKSRKLAYDWVEIPVAEKDFSKIYLDNVKSSDGVNNTAMAISDWLEEITKIESMLSTFVSQ